MNFVKKHGKTLVILADVLLVPGLILCKWLSGHMIAEGESCSWTRIGAQCGTCGGTRLVSSLLSGDIGAAYRYNPFLFVCVVYLAVTAVLVNLRVLCRWEPAGRVLKRMYNLAALFIAFGIFALFIIVRNIPFWVWLFAYIDAVM